MANWVETHSQGFRWHAWHCTKERRPFYLYRGGEVLFKPQGRHITALFDRVTAIGYVSLLPQAIHVVSPELMTKDGIPVRAKLSAYLAVSDSDFALRRVAIDARGQEALATQAMVGTLQKACLRLQCAELRTNTPLVASELEEEFAAEVSAKRLAFELRTLLIEDFNPIDHLIAKALLERARASEEAGRELLRLQHEQEVARLKSVTEREQAEAEAQLERIRGAVSVDIERARAEMALEMERLELSVKEETARVASLPQGETVLFPNERYKLEGERIRALAANQKQLEQFHEFLMKYAVQGAVTQGQLETLRAAFQKQYGISVSSPLDGLPEPIAALATALPSGTQATGPRSSTPSTAAPDEESEETSPVP